MLACLYTIRIFIGANAVGVSISQWLLAFAMFFFLGLAFVKRFSELYIFGEMKKAVKGRGYLVSDLERVANFGVVSSYISILVLALYINSNEVMRLYQHPMILWGICPLLLYWVSRVWFLTCRAQIHDDPVVFALKDKVSYVIGLIALGLIYLAI